MNANEREYGFSRVLHAGYGYRAQSCGLYQHPKVNHAEILHLEEKIVSCQSLLGRAEDASGTHLIGT